MKKIIGMAMSFVFIASISGCATQFSPDSYDAQSAMTMQQVSYGTVQSVRGVSINGGGSGSNAIGTIGGAVIGGLLGSGVGAGLGRNLAIAGGAIAGGVAGNAIAGGVSRENGVEIGIRLDNGANIAVVQGIGAQIFHIGQRVQVARGYNGQVRVQ